MKKDIWLDGMMGLIVGDALGVPVQFMSREEIADRDIGPVTGMESGGVYDMPEGTWSDDSSMALATLVSIIEKKAVDAGDIMLRFVRWELKGEYTPFGEAFDQGNTCTTAIYNFIQHPDIMTCGCTHGRSNGNGSLMRILPVCLYYAEKQRLEDLSDNEAVEGIHLISGLTHNHIRSKLCCGLYYFMIRSVFNLDCGSGEGSLLSTLQTGIDDGLRYYGRKIELLTELAHMGRLFHLDEFRNAPDNEIKTTGYVVDSIEAAVWCLINTKSYRECMLKAVNLGDDTDTIAAIAGGIAGLYYGYNSIPDEWLGVIKRRDWIEEMCRRQL